MAWNGLVPVESLVKCIRCKFLKPLHSRFQTAQLATGQLVLCRQLTSGERAAYCYPWSPRAFWRSRWFGKKWTLFWIMSCATYRSWRAFRSLALRQTWWPCQSPLNERYKFMKSRQGRLDVRLVNSLSLEACISFIWCLSGCLVVRFTDSQTDSQTDSLCESSKDRLKNNSLKQSDSWTERKNIPSNWKMTINKDQLVQHWKQFFFKKSLLFTSISNLNGSMNTFELKLDHR